MAHCIQRQGKAVFPFMCYFTACPSSGHALQLLRPFFYSSSAHSSVVAGRCPPSLSIQACTVIFFTAWNPIVLPVHRLVKCPREPDYKLCWECFAVRSAPWCRRHLVAISSGLQSGGVGDLEQIFIAHWLQPASNLRVKWTRGEMRDMAQARVYVYVYNSLWKLVPTLQTLKLLPPGNITKYVVVTWSRYLRKPWKRVMPLFWSHI